MPHHIYGFDVHTYEHDEEKRTVADFLSEFDFPVDEVKWGKAGGEYTAVYFRSAVHFCACIHVYGIILVREQAGDKFYGVEHCLE